MPCRVRCRKVEAEMEPHPGLGLWPRPSGSWRGRQERKAGGVPYCQSWGSDLVCVQVSGVLLPSSPQTRVLCRPGSLQDRGSHSPASRNVGSYRRPTTESFSANCPWKLLLGSSTPDGCSLQGYNGLLPQPGSCHLRRAIPT